MKTVAEMFYKCCVLLNLCLTIYHVIKIYIIPLRRPLCINLIEHYFDNATVDFVQCVT